MKEEKDFFKTCFDVVAGLEVQNETQAIAKEVVLDEIENLQSQLKAKEEVIKEARDYVNFIAITTRGIKKELIDKCEKGFVKFNKTLWGEELEEILSKGENK